MNRILLHICLLFCAVAAFAAPRQHVATFGKWTIVKSFNGENEDQSIDLKIRALIVDGRVKTFIFGTPHDITDETFVVQRIFRLNDSLQQENGPPRWRWERGGWLMVDRVTGKVQPLTLPDFDPYYSTVAWFRDYAAYCGLSDDGQKLFAIVSQLGRRKPALKKPIGDFANSDAPSSACSAPVWQRSPMRVTFAPDKQPKFMFTVRSRSLDLTPIDEETAEE